MTTPARHQVGDASRKSTQRDEEINFFAASILDCILYGSFCDCCAHSSHDDQTMYERAGQIGKIFLIRSLDCPDSYENKKPKRHLKVHLFIMISSTHRRSAHV